MEANVVNITEGAEGISHVVLAERPFESLLLRRGWTIELERALMCPCWSLDSGAPDYQCAHCGGMGWLFADAETTYVDGNGETQTLKAVLQGVSTQLDPSLSIGLLEAGQCICTITDRIGIGYMDRITAPESRFLHKTEMLVKGSRDQITTYKALSIVRCAAIVGGRVVDYRPDVDVRIDGEQNTVLWIGDAPPDGAQYTMTYWAVPIWHVFTDCPQIRHHEDRRLPTKVVLVRKDRIHESRNIDTDTEESS